MAIDPRNYDLDELRAASVGQPSFGERDEWAEAGASSGATKAKAGANENATEEQKDLAEADRPAAAVAFETAVARDLATMDGSDVERPYLSTLPASLTAEVLIFEWLDFLVMQADRESVADAFDFYERVGWLGGDAAAMLDEYLSGLGDSRAEMAGGLDADDHRVSLHYVARLASISQQ